MAKELNRDSQSFEIELSSSQNSEKIDLKEKFIKLSTGFSIILNPHQLPFNFSEYLCEIEPEFGGRKILRYQMEVLKTIFKDEVFYCENLVEIENGYIIGLNLLGNKQSGKAVCIELDECIERLSNLHRLSIDNLNLTCLPQKIGFLSNLKVLSVSNNSLSSLEQVDFQSLSSLEEVDFQENNLVSLPPTIEFLIHLTNLNLKNNLLTNLPESIGTLVNLKTLNLAKNHLISLPESIGELISLEEMDLGENNFQTLPNSIINLRNLKKLDLHNNSLIALPFSIHNRCEIIIDLDQFLALTPIYEQNKILIWELGVYRNTWGHVADIIRLGLSNNYSLDTPLEDRMVLYRRVFNKSAVARGRATRAFENWEKVIFQKIVEFYWDF